MSNITGFYIMYQIVSVRKVLYNIQFKARNDIIQNVITRKELQVYFAKTDHILIYTEEEN